MITWAVIEVLKVYRIVYKCPEIWKCIKMCEICIGVQFFLTLFTSYPPLSWRWFAWTNCYIQKHDTCFLNANQTITKNNQNRKQIHTSWWTKGSFTMPPFPTCNDIQVINSEFKSSSFFLFLFSYEAIIGVPIWNIKKKIKIDNVLQNRYKLPLP